MLLSSVEIKYQLFFFLFATIPFLFACEEITDWELNPEVNGKIVVEGILTDELTNQEIRLSRSFSGLNEQAPVVTNAVVKVSVRDADFFFLPVAETPGLYKSISPFAVAKNLPYILEVSVDGEIYQAKSELSFVAPIPKFTFKTLEGSNWLTLDTVPFYYNANQQSMYDLQIEWSHLTGNSSDRAKRVLYTFNDFAISRLIPATTDTIAFPPGSKVTIKKFGLNEDFADYLRALVIETEWRGGAFYGTPNSLPTNISNDGLGFFSTCAVLVDSLVAE